MSKDKQRGASGEPEVMEKIVSLCKRRGFVFQSSEIYGGLKSCYDYGPLGAELKRNVKAEWWRSMVHQRQDVVGLDASIMMSPEVWKASGHLSGFTDPLVDCKLCKERFRADKAPTIVDNSNQGDSVEVEYVIISPNDALIPVIEKQLNLLDANGSFARKGRRFAAIAKINLQNLEADNRISVSFSRSDGHAHTQNYWAINLAPNIKCPVCSSPFLSDIRRFNLMFRTTIGAIDNIDAIAKAIEGKELRGEDLKALIAEAINKTAVYLRPETAQAMFVNFLNVQSSSRLKPPFGIAQQGKSFRNEITVEHFTFRSCEFEQMEMEFFVPPPGMEDEGAKTDMDWYEYWCQERFDWYKSLGIREENLRLRVHEQDELAHYAKGCKDVEYLYPWGWGELEGIAHRSDYDLKAHEKASGKKLTYFDPQRNAHYHPFVIEPAAGADRAALAFLLDSYTEEPPSEGRKDGRVLLKLHPRLAPIKAAVLPLVRKEGMPEKAREIVDQFFSHGINSFYDEKDAIGRRYARQDEAGTPYCLTVDGQTLEDGTVTIRERDTMAQERIKVAEAVKVVQERLAQ